MSTWLCHACGQPATLVFKDNQYAGTDCCGATAQHDDFPLPMPPRPPRQVRLL